MERDVQILCEKFRRRLAHVKSDKDVGTGYYGVIFWAERAIDRGDLLALQREIHDALSAHPCQAWENRLLSWSREIEELTAHLVDKATLTEELR